MQDVLARGSSSAAHRAAAAFNAASSTSSGGAWSPNVSSCEGCEPARTQTPSTQATATRRATCTCLEGVLHLAVSAYDKQAAKRQPVAHQVALLHHAVGVLDVRPARSRRERTRLEATTWDRKTVRSFAHARGEAHQMREKGLRNASSEPRRTWPPPTALNTSLVSSRKSSPAGQYSLLNSATCSSRSSCKTATRRTPALSSCALMPCSSDTSARQSWQPGRRTARITTGRSAHKSLALQTALVEASSGLSGASASAAVDGSGTTGAMLARAVENDAAVAAAVASATRRASSMRRRTARSGKVGHTDRGGLRL